MILHLDYETRSLVDLKRHGVYIYAQHPSTEIICAAYAFGDEDPELWTPDLPFPQRVAEHFDTGERASVWAHNADFERLITWYVLCPDFDVPEPPLEAFYCTAAQMRAAALPGSLGNAARALSLREQKGIRGAELIRLLSLPQDPNNII